MTFTEALLKIPIMLYVAAVLLPIMMVCYALVSKQRRAVSVRKADPALMLAEKKIDVKRVVIVNLVLGSTIGIGIALLIFFALIGFDWYNSTGLFAVELPRETIPPAMIDKLPPQPPTYTGAD